MQGKNSVLPVMNLNVSAKIKGTLPSGFSWVTFDADTTELAQRVNVGIKQEPSPYLLLVNEGVIVDEALSKSIEELIAELNRDYGNWGVCGATGVRWDGERTYWYIRRVPHNPEAGVCPKPVISVGSEILLLNLEQLRAKGCFLAEAPCHVNEIGPQLALECLRKQLCVLVDRRLMVVDTTPEVESGEYDAVAQMLQEHFVNHQLQVPSDIVKVPQVAYQEFLSLPPVSHQRRDVISCYDAAIANSRESRPLSLTIACRSQLNRPHLLERTMLSCAVAKAECPVNFELRVALISDVLSESLDAETARLKQRFPSLDIKGLHVTPRSRETSRVDHLLSAIAALTSDYIWFVDDDDFVMPGAVQALARVLVPNAPVVFVGSSDVFEERWSGGELRDFIQVGAHSSRHVFDVFQGENFVPICGMIIPTVLARERCNSVAATGEYLEDYFILMQLLTSPRVEVEILSMPISGVSLRGQENTVREKQRDTWNRSYAQFVGELLRSSASANPLLWQMVRR